MEVNRSLKGWIDEKERLGVQKEWDLAIFVRTLRYIFKKLVFLQNFFISRFEEILSEQDVFTSFFSLILFFFLFEDFFWKKTF